MENFCFYFLIIFFDNEHRTKKPIEPIWTEINLRQKINIDQQKCSKTLKKILRNCLKIKKLRGNFFSVGYTFNIVKIQFYFSKKQNKFGNLVLGN